MITTIEEAITLEHLITGEQFAQMGDLGACELIAGRVVPMTPPKGTHGVIEALLAWFLQSFVLPRKLGWVLTGEAGIYTGRNPDTIRGMDVAFISRARQPTRPAGYLTVAPELIIEIISPTDRWRDVRDKIEEYFVIGVERVWLVDPERKLVLVYRSEQDFIKLTEVDTLRGEGLLAGFELSLTALFDAE